MEYKFKLLKKQKTIVPGRWLGFRFHIIGILSGCELYSQGARFNLLANEGNTYTTDEYPDDYYS